MRTRGYAPFSNNLSPPVTLKMESFSSFTCPSNIGVQLWLKSIHSFKRQDADKPFLNNLSPPGTLKMGSRSPKSNQHFPPPNDIFV